jgi:hypothetical protein
MCQAEGARLKVRFTGHSRIVDPQYGTYFTTTVWCLEFGDASRIFERFVDS